VNVEKELSRILEGRTDEHLIRELLGKSRPKKGADVAAFRRLQRGKEYIGNRKTPRKDDGLLGCSRRTALRRE
jgi:hypothetical protein